MPLTFIDIEKQKNWRIGIFFLFLMILYGIVCLALALPFMPHSIVFSHGAGSARFFSLVLLISFVGAAIHFWFVAFDSVADVSRGLNAQLPDPTDDVHRVFLNIMQEIHTVTGNQRRIDAAVIPTLSLNALAAADLKGNAVIAVTEGLLSRLSRPQLETVVAHEAHHVLSGDCLQTTIAASLFGSLSSLIDKWSQTRGERSFVHPALWPAWLLLKLSYLMNMFISREREYRADAAAVRMTRDPISLAETLYLLSRNWRGAGFIGSGYEMLCIINPQMNAVDESEGFLADLLSTHPPIRKRIDVLLGMAHMNIAAPAKKTGPRTAAAESPKPYYYAVDPQKQWQGPFELLELRTLPWLSPLTWIRMGEDLPTDRAWKNPFVNTIFTERLKQEQKVSAFTCPVCKQPLVEESYEGTRVYQCRFCSGTLVENDKIPRILARRNHGRICSERVKTLAKATVLEHQRKAAEQKLANLKRMAAALLPCPKCKNAMFRAFYSAALLIEIDRCSWCGITWFDRDELEMLQSLTEQGSTIAYYTNANVRTEEIT